MQLPIRSLSSVALCSEPGFASTKANFGLEEGEVKKPPTCFLAPSLNCSCCDVLVCVSVQCLVVIGKDEGVCSQFPNKARVFHNDLFIFTKTLSSALADVCVSRLLLTESSLRILISAVCYVHFNNCIGGHKTPQLFSPYISSSMTNRWSVRLRPVCRAPVIFAC